MDWYIGVLQKYTVFTGRARRTEYWMFFLINMIITWGLGIIDSFLGTDVGGDPGYGLLSSLYSLGVLLPSIGVMIRRLHDAGKSGWFFWINLIPIIGWIWFFVVLVTDSVPGDNQYGPNPKGIGSYQADYPSPGNQYIGTNPAADDIPGQIKKLSELKDAKILSESEFEAKKRELLSKM